MIGKRRLDGGHPEPRVLAPRQSQRRALEAEVLSKQIGMRTYKVRVFNVSSEGCKIEFVERPKVGDELLVKFEGLEPLGAVVCWVDGFTGGVEFSKRVHPAVLTSLIARIDSRSE